MKTGSSGKALSVMIGLFAVVMLCASAGISVPLVKKYDQFRPEMLLVVRGLAVAIALLAVKGPKAYSFDKYILIGGLLFTIASITFFQAVNLWGANPVITIITLTPVVNFVVALGQRTHICKVTVFSLILVLVGVTLALYVPNQRFDPYGFVLSVIATVSTSLGMECWAKTTVKLPGKMMMYSLSLVVLSSIVLLTTPGKIEVIPRGVTFLTALYVFGIIGCFGGIIYFCSASIALERLPVTTASILMQGETPAVIVGSWLIAGENVSLLQAVGVAVMIVGISMLMIWTAEEAKKNSEAARAS